MKRILCLVLSVLFCGCTTVTQVGDPGLPPQQIGNEIVRAVQKGDYAGFKRYAGARETRGEREAFTRSCEQIRSEYGTIRSFRFLTTLKTPLAVNQLYVVEMARPGTDGKLVTREMIFQLLLGQSDGKWRVLGMRFI